MIDRERLDHWLERGAEPTRHVKKLMRAENTAAVAPPQAAAAPAERGDEAEAPCRRG